MRFAKRKITPLYLGGKDCLNIGFVPTMDCAVLIAAQELGIFRKYDLTIRLSREVGWATIREKLLHEELDAAATHASMGFSIYCGIGVMRRPCLTGLLLGLNGSAITLSNRLWNLGVRDALSLGRLVHEQKTLGTLQFGAVLKLSSQNYILRKWLESGGIDPDHDVRITIIPSVLIYDSFAEGYLDGYCVAEPWNSVATLKGTGWVTAISSEVDPGHPEKVLLVLQEFAEKREDEHLRMIAALIEASEFCDDPANRTELARLLSKSRCFDVDESVLLNSLVGPFNFGRGQRNVPDFITFNARKSGAPDRPKGKRVFDLVRTLTPGDAGRTLNSDVIARVFREDIFDQALKIFLAKQNVPNRQTGRNGPVERPLNGHSPKALSARCDSHFRVESAFCVYFDVFPPPRPARKTPTTLSA